MAKTHGKETAFTITDSGSTERDISAYLTSVDFSRDVDTPESTTFGDDDREYIVGLRGASFSVSGFWDDTATSGPDVVLNGLLGLATASTFEYGPEGSTTGDIRYTGSCFLTSYSTSSPVDGITTFSADFIVTGAVTRDTF